MQHEDSGASASHCIDDVDVALASPEHEITSNPLRILQGASASKGEVDLCVGQNLHDSDEIKTIQESLARELRDSLAHTPSHFSTAVPLVTPEWGLGTWNSEIAGFHYPRISTLNNGDSPYADPDIYTIETDAMSDGYHPQTVTSLTMTLDDLSTATGLTPHPSEDMSHTDDDIDNHRLFERKHDGTYHESTNEKKEELVTPTEPAQTVADGTHAALPIQLETFNNAPLRRRGG
ncbi:hypothetical protein AAF712_015566 [Marasmius tenuissimus]|uniref:Uncharacterized protein n=1 Tax=Marasmius tenuissimus TaxID=585030 RepID=A0ABR2Z7X8_9AGAR